jgi:Raf kinase inhibitor-like YbhB/YbcL family protein
MRRLLCIALTSLFAMAAIAEDAPSTAFTLTTNAFLDTGPIPVMYTCDGKDVSPQLEWSNVPAKTQSFAILITDADTPNGNFYHWVVYNIPSSVATIAETSDKLPAGALAGKNSFGKLSYNGPCPPKGSVHTYTITLYALDAKLSLPAGADGKSLTSAMQKHTLGKASLTMVYSRWI